MTKILGLRGLVSRFDRQVWALFCASIISMMGTSLVMTYMSIYIYDNYGKSYILVGIADFIIAIVGAFAAYAGGAACDTYGRKKILMIGLSLQIVSYLIISLSIDSHVAIGLFIAALAFNSFNASIYRTIPDVMLADIVEPEDLVESYGLLRIASNLGWVIGPALGGIFLMFTTYASLFHITALTTFAYLLIAILLLRDTKPGTAPERFKPTDIVIVARDRPFLMFCLLMLFMIIPYQQMYTLFPVYTSAYVGLDKFWIGMLFTLSGAMVALFQYYISTKVSRYRMTTALAFSAIVFALGFVMLSISNAFFMPFIGMAVITFAEMIWAPAGSTLLAGMAPERMRGRYFGFNGFTGNIGWALGPLFGAVLMIAMNSNVSYIWAVVGAAFLVPVAGFLGLNRIVPKSANGGKEKETEEKITA